MTPAPNPSPDLPPDPAGRAIVDCPRCLRTRWANSRCPACEPFADDPAAPVEGVTDPRAETPYNRSPKSKRRRDP